MATQGFESDSAEQQASTADEVEESSRRSTTDDFGPDSDVGSTTDADSNEENLARKKNLTPKERKKYTDARLDPVKMSNAQSDTETKNLLDDIGEDLDDEYLNLQEADNLNDHNGLFEHDVKLFDLSEEQINYYTNCFLYLLQKTQGFASLQGALHGMDRIVLEFFRKSRLDDLALSKIWSLSDVNEDGFLNLVEFITAMHLIVLHIKGNVPIPSQLPLTSRPPITPTRTLIRREDVLLAGIPDNSMEVNSNSSSNKVTSECISSSSGQSRSLTGNQQERRENKKEFGKYGFGDIKLYGTSPQQAATTTAGKQHSLSDDHLNSAQRGIAIAKFSDVPPLLVDGHPTALDAATSSHMLPEFARLFVSTNRGPPPQPPHRDYKNGTKGHGRSVSLDLKTFSAISSNLCYQQSFPRDTTDGSSVDKENENNLSNKIECLTNEKAIQATCSTSTAETQTNCDVIFREETLAMQIKDLDVKFGPRERCKMLQRINEQLEMERSKLVQIRLQVQLRIEEAETQIENQKRQNKSTSV